MWSGDIHHLAKLLALKDLSDLRSHAGKLGVGGDDLVKNGGVGHGARHLLKELRVVEHALHLDVKHVRNAVTSLCIDKV